jgi:hypothetical protein
MNFIGSRSLQNASFEVGNALSGLCVSFLVILNLFDGPS